MITIKDIFLIFIILGKKFKCSDEILRYMFPRYIAQGYYCHALTQSLAPGSFWQIWPIYNFSLLSARPVPWVVFILPSNLFAHKQHRPLIQSAYFIVGFSALEARSWSIYLSISKVVNTPRLLGLGTVTFPLPTGIAESLSMTFWTSVGSVTTIQIAAGLQFAPSPGQ